MNLLKCYVVGSGFMGATHLSCHLANPKVKVLGIVDINEEKGKDLADRNGLKWFPDLKSAFASEMADFCDICLPSAFHMAGSVEAMELGADVVCEKPMAVEPEHVAAMKEAAKRTGRRLMIAHVCRFMPQYYLLKELLDKGGFGKPISMMIGRESETPAWSFNNWLFDSKLSGGTVLDLGIHDLDLVNWYFGKPEYCHLEATSTENRKGVDSAVSVLGYPGGVQATVVTNHLLQNGHPFATYYRLTCADATVEFNTVFSKDSIKIYRDRAEEVVKINDLPGFEDGYAHELSVFVDALLERKEFPINLDDAELAVATVRNLYATMHRNG